MQDVETPQRQKTKVITSQRCPATVVRALSSNHLAEKYELLVDKRLAIADYEIKKIKIDLQQATDEHDLRRESLRLDIEIKKKNSAVHDPTQINYFCFYI